MLVVEDDELSQNLMRMVFRIGFEIEICESAKEYYEKFSDKIFDIIIMDISLKGQKNGLELTKEIKANTSYTGTPILCLTAHAQPQMRQTALDAGADGFMTKPVGNKAIREAVELLINQTISRPTL